MKSWLFGLLLGATLSAVAAPVSTSVIADADMRADKVPGAQVLRKLTSGTSVELLSLEGGWAWISADGKPGWVRASALKLQAGTSAAAQVGSGREHATAPIGALAVRSLPVRANRHALVIGISRYADPTLSPVPGARIDTESATQIALAMQVPESNITVLRDEQATSDGIRNALRELDSRVAPGDRVFIHFSGHGTRRFDAQAGGCTEALMAYEGGRTGAMGNREVAELLTPLSRKADKMFVMYDACYSGGVGSMDTDIRVKGVALPSDEGRLRPKFTPAFDECLVPANVKTRSLISETTSRGALPHDIVHLSSSRDNEISLDDEEKGGLATQFVRDCMLRDAVDVDGSGAISLDEVRMCAQRKIDLRMAKDELFTAQNLVLAGNISFVPAWFSAQQVAPRVPPPPLSGAQALQQVFDQRDAKRNVSVALAQRQLKIGRGELDLSVSSDRAGYVYVLLAGSDNNATYLLFPNALDSDNRVQPARTLKLPRASWKVRAQGPAGTDHLLVLVADTPRDLAQLQAARAGPFMKSLNDANGRAALGALLASDAFGAALVSVEETP